VQRVKSGVVPTREALRMAQQAELDLVEVAPNSTPPVCRIMDFGKFLYEKEKKEREARKAQTKVEIKEIRLRPKTPVPTAISRWKTPPLAGP